MVIAVINKTKQDIVAACRAIDRQVREHLAPIWWLRNIPVMYYADEMRIPSQLNPWRVYVTDSIDHMGQLGYHKTDAQGNPYGCVSVSETLRDGLAVSGVLSHEVLEMCVDPYVDLWCGNYALEVCDPVGLDFYKIDGVTVSNFVTPSWFRRGQPPYDYMGRLGATLQFTGGGYAVTRTGIDGDNTIATGKINPASRTIARLNA